LRAENRAFGGSLWGKVFGCYHDGWMVEGSVKMWKKVEKVGGERSEGVEVGWVWRKSSWGIEACAAGRHSWRKRWSPYLKPEATPPPTHHTLKKLVVVTVKVTRGTQPIRVVPFEAWKPTRTSSRPFYIHFLQILSFSSSSFFLLLLSLSHHHHRLPAYQPTRLET